MGDSFRKTFSARIAFRKNENKMMSDSYGSYIIYNQADYAHHITASPPGFENPAASAENIFLSKYFTSELMQILGYNF